MWEMYDTWMNVQTSTKTKFFIYTVTSKIQFTQKICMQFNYMVIFKRTVSIVISKNKLHQKFKNLIYSVILYEKTKNSGSYRKVTRVMFIKHLKERVTIVFVKAVVEKAFFS